ncbi:MAG TPA: hypothetical protein VHE61_02935 [Opitutaceae bacterium]|nr:hypothetical protein [Opitutaceae bacterium]
MLTHVYYNLKPYVPWQVRLAVRRIVARRKRRQHASTWPIDPTAAKRPAGWPGWPDGKKFAFVITHDVEDVIGVQKCRDLFSLELAHGFRSSFNFIPEGPYRVSPELRNELTRAGFEVGIHDLRHDGKLFRSRHEFRQSAERINGYIHQWSASGYRSGFMLRQLDWLHDLAIVYDASTFDTDPFEPQPDGAGTIFPFWISHPDEKATGRGVSGRGYVELPYTLPQDSTLFLVLRETSPEIWLRKLDWIASHGGMALVNVHPDYVNFSNRRTRREFPATHYAELLQHVTAKYAEEFWNPLPHELAAWFKKTHDCGIVAR